MIAKVFKTGHLNSIVDYVYREDKAPLVVESTCMESDRLGALEDLKFAISQREDVKKPIMHAVLSAAPDDQMDAQRWHEISQQYMKQMGFEHARYVAVMHHDTDHSHVHIIASRIKDDGVLISDSHDYYRSQEIVRQLEQAHQLTPVPCSWEVERRQMKQSLRHRDPSIERARDHMERALVASMKEAKSIHDLRQMLHEQNIEMVPNVRDHDIRGVSFKYNEVRLAGSKMGHGWRHLSSAIDYDKGRDFERLNRPIETFTPSRYSARDVHGDVDGHPALKALTSKQAPVMARSPDGLLSVDELIHAQRARGYQWSTRAHAHVQQMTVMERDVMTRDGQYTVLVDDQKRALLIPTRSSYEPLRGRDVVVEQQVNQSPKLTGQVRTIQARDWRGPIEDDPTLSMWMTPGTAQARSRGQLMDQHQLKAHQPTWQMAAPENMRGKTTVMEADVMLHEGRYSLLVNKDKQVFLTPHTPHLEQMKGQDIYGSHVQIPQMTLQRFKAQFNDGRQIGILKDNQKVQGRLVDDALSLQEGRYRVIETYGRHLVLVPKTDEDMAYAVGQRVEVKRTGQTTQVKPLEMGPDIGR